MKDKKVVMDERIRTETAPFEGTSGAPFGGGELEELEWLMSLALDGRLDEVDSARLDVLLAAESGGLSVWQDWQAFDTALHRAPAYAPPVDFLAGVEQKVVQWERRRRLWAGVTIGAAALVLWGSALVGLATLGAFAFSNQAVWMSEMIHGIAFAWVRFTSLVHFVWIALMGLAATPQALALGVCYALAAAVMLGLWIGFLRKTTRTDEAVIA